MKERYEFDPKKAYRLIAVTDKEGNDKVHTRLLYEERVGCIATEFTYDEEYYHQGECLYMSFVQTKQMMPKEKKMKKKGSKIHEILYCISPRIVTRFPKDISVALGESNVY